MVPNVLGMRSQIMKGHSRALPSRLEMKYSVSVNNLSSAQKYSQMSSETLKVLKSREGKKLLWLSNTMTLSHWPVFLDPHSTTEIFW